MNGIQAGERVPNFRRLDESGVVQTFYELHYGQPILLAVLPDDAESTEPDQLAALNSEDPVWDRVTRLALRHARPEACAGFHRSNGLKFPVLADDGHVASFLTGRKVQDRMRLLVLDRNLRVAERIDEPDKNLTSQIARVIDGLARPEPVVMRCPAPVLVLPRVLEPALCTELISTFEAHGGMESGVLYHEGGEQRWAPAPDIKIRRDMLVEDQDMQRRLRGLVSKRVLPEIERSFNFRARRQEPFKMVRYGGESGGYFRPHRDNVTKDAAHRRFAITINLNDPESYRGGQLRFPEHSPHLYQPPAGGAIVFSCSLVHEAVDVTEGHRYALLGFFF